MAVYVLKNCKLYSGGYNLSGDMNQMMLMSERSAKDINVFGDSTEHSIPGLLKTSIEHKGFYQVNDNDFEVDDVLNADFALADVISTICPSTGVAGEVAYTTKALELAYNLNGQVGEVFAFTVNATGTGNLIRGTIMETGAKTSTGNGTARQLGAVTASQKIYAAAHVIAVSGTNPTLDLTIESDDAVGMLSATERIAFSQFTAIGAEWQEVAGAITDDWWRATWTIGGTNDPSFIIIVIVGIR